jgi:hypothetical protein
MHLERVLQMTHTGWLVAFLLYHRWIVLDTVSSDRFITPHNTNPTCEHVPLNQWCMKRK